MYGVDVAFHVVIALAGIGAGWFAGIFALQDSLTKYVLAQNPVHSHNFCGSVSLNSFVALAGFFLTVCRGFVGTDLCVLARPGTLDFLRDCTFS